MRNTFSASLVCSPSKARKNGLAPIEISLSVCGNRVLIALPKKCSPQEFKKIMASGRENDIKSFCLDALAKISKIQTTLSLSGAKITAASVKNAFLNGTENLTYTIGNLTDDFLKYKTSDGGPVNKYRKDWSDFLSAAGLERGDALSNIQPSHILTYRAKADKLYKPDTMRGKLKRIKSFFIWAVNSGKLQTNPFYPLKISYKTEDKPFLTYDEIEKIREAKLDDRLDRVRNFFLFLCFSGLEYSDIVALKKDDVKKNRFGQLYIKKPRVKTGIEYLSILYEDAEEMWELFDGDIPVISNAKTNAYLKQIAEIAGIDKNITTLTARHTYGTYLLSKRAIPIEVVQKMLGHATPKQSLHYAKMLDESVFLANIGKTEQKIEATKRDMEDSQYFNSLFE